MKWLQEGLKSLEICKKIGLCTDLSRNADGVACDMCQTVVKKIEELMVDKKIEAEIIAACKLLCLKIPAPYSTLCDLFVTQYVPVIMKWLQEGLKSLEICKKVGLCTDFARQADGVACDMCQTIVKKIEELMVDTRIESEIIAACQKLCVKLPAPYSTLCDALVAQYVPVIMKWLQEGFKSLEICNKIGLCDKALARIPIDEENGITCDICKDFFKWAGKEIEKYTVPFLWKLVNEKCPKVPYLRNFCKIINEQNIETFVNLLVSAVSPEKACQFIRIC
jgi:saposin